MKNQVRRIAWNAGSILFSTVASAALLTACGGGGGSSGDSSTPLTVRVIDGYISGATVCVDTNLNGVCDKGEPQGTTDASGNVTLKVPSADVGKYPLIANIPAGAVDADDPTTPIATAYTLTAPKDAGPNITPLTTLVQHMVEGGLTTQEAANLVQQQTGVKDALADHVQADNANARALAKTLVQIVQSKGVELAGVGNGTTQDPITNATITRNDVDRSVREAIVKSLSDIVSAIPTECAATIDAACKKAITNAVSGDTGLAAQLSITTANAATTVGLKKGAQPEITAPTSTPTSAPSASLKWLNYTDPSNWFYRMLASSAAENVPDSNGFYRYHDRIKTSVNGQVTDSGGLIVNGRTDDVHWNGTAWVSTRWLPASTTRWTPTWRTSPWWATPPRALAIDWTTPSPPTTKATSSTVGLAMTPSWVAWATTLSMAA